ncbi:MAG: hypothetical protein Greene041619_470 [Candidatus Peregrinibacteria bacterium Greene0416_19]|nr:MAG: hypothetical protein Greene041619_470 [Candidatus Peregrinibacteria bacterium Greene0416_19]
MTLRRSATTGPMSRARTQTRLSPEGLTKGGTPALALALTLALTLILAPVTARAQRLIPASACIGQVNDLAAQEQRVYRGVLFGIHSAADEPLGTTRYDIQRNPWIKLRHNEWRTAVPRLSRTALNDSRMDALSERDWFAANTSTPVRRGIFETRGALTSELVPHLTQSYRAFQCRLAAICIAAERAQSLDPQIVMISGIAYYEVTVPGCVAARVPAPTSCFLNALGSTAGPPGAGTQFATAADQVIARTYCPASMAELAGREAELLKLATGYDAAYRTLLQFAGMTDVFLGAFRTDLLTPLRQALPLVGQLARIPCFLAECNE